MFDKKIVLLGLLILLNVVSLYKEGLLFLGILIIIEIVLICINYIITEDCIRKLKINVIVIIAIGIILNSYCLYIINLDINKLMMLNLLLILSSGVGILYKKYEI